MGKIGTTGLDSANPRHNRNLVFLHAKRRNKSVYFRREVVVSISLGALAWSNLQSHYLKGE